MLRLRSTLSALLIVLSLFSSSCKNVRADDTTAQITSASFCTEVEVEENSYCDTVNAEDDPEAAFKAIHKAYNEATNTYFAQKIKALSGTTFQNDPTRDQKAAQSDVFNVYTERTQELHKYETALNTLATQENQQAPGSAKIYSLQDAINAIDSFKNTVNAEKNLADRALRVTLRAYGEMRLFYTLHKELEAFISTLQKLQSAWIDLGTQVARMPAKFINAAKHFK